MQTDFPYEIVYVVIELATFQCEALATTHFDLG